MRLRKGVLNHNMPLPKPAGDFSIGFFRQEKSSYSMFIIIGFVVVLVSVIVGYILSHGNLGILSF